MVRSSKFQTLDHLLSTVGSRKVTVRVDSDLKAESSVDLSGYNLAFYFQRNGSLNVASGKVVSGLVLANDPSWQIFTGSVSLSPDVTVQSPQWWGYASGGYADIVVSGTRSIMNHHAVEDWTVRTPDTPNLGYASYDAKPTISGSGNNNHLVGYQARPIYNSSGNLTQYMHGFDTDMSHTGSGVISNASSVYIKDVGGTGIITNNYGLYIEYINRGSNNTAIYSANGNAHYLGGSTGSIETGVIKANGLNFGVDTNGKTISYGYGSAGQTYFGKHDFYDGKNTVIATIDSSGITLAGILKTTAVTFVTDTSGKTIAYGYGTVGQANYGKHQFYNGKNGLVAEINSSGLDVTGKITATGPIQHGSYTVASLPAGTNGQTAYASNGRKIGEGAGVGTGVMVYYSNGAWRRLSDDTVVVS